LMTLGAAFAVGLLLVVWGGLAALRFKSEQAPFVTRFTADLARHWNVADVYSRLDNSFIEQASSVQGRQVLEQFKRLGPLRATEDLQMQNYYLSPGATTALFTLKAIFANGDAIVSISLIRRDHAVRVVSFDLRAVHLQPTTEKTVRTPAAIRSVRPA